MSQKDKNFFNIDALEQGISHTLGEGITTRIFPGQQAMISVVRIEPNVRGVMIEGSAIRIQDSEEIAVEKGYFWCSSGRIEHGIIGGPDGAIILDIFSPPRPEYTKPGRGFAATDCDDSQKRRASGSMRVKI